MLSLAVVLTVFSGLTMSVSAGKITEYKVQYGTSGATYITLTKQDDDNIIRYTADGSKPDEDSSVYKKRLKTTSGCVFRAIEFTPDGKKVSSIKINLKLKVRALEFSEKKLNNGKSMVTISTPTEDAEIHYTLDGSTPDEDSDILEGSLIISKNCKIRAVAYKDGYKRSSIKSYSVYVKSDLEESDSSDDADIAAGEKDNDDDDDDDNKSTSTSKTNTSSTKKDDDDKEEPELDNYGIPNVPLTGDFTIESYVNDMAVLVNQFRKSNNINSQVVVDPVLCRVALKRAYEYGYGYVSSRPDRTIWNTVLDQYKVSFMYAGQFYGYGFRDSQAFFNSVIQNNNSVSLLKDGSLTRMGIANVKVNNMRVWMMVMVNPQ